MTEGGARGLPSPVAAGARRVPTRLAARLVLAGACALGLASCRTTALPVPVPRPVPIEGEGERQRLEGYLEAVRKGSGERRALRVVGKLHLESPDGSGSTRQVIAVERPASLRFESLNLLGQTRALLVADGERFSFYDGRELSRGLVTADVLRELLGLDLRPSEAVGVLLGTPALDAGPTQRVLGLGSERIAELAGQRVRFAGDGELLGVDVLEAGGLLRWRVEYGAWREGPGGRYPSTLLLLFPRSALRARLEVNEAELNPDLDPALFHVPPGRNE